MPEAPKRSCDDPSSAMPKKALGNCALRPADLSLLPRMAMGFAAGRSSPALNCARPVRAARPCANRFPRLASALLLGRRELCGPPQTGSSCARGVLVRPPVAIARESPSPHRPPSVPPTSDPRPLVRPSLRPSPGPSPSAAVSVERRRTPRRPWTRMRRSQLRWWWSSTRRTKSGRSSAVGVCESVEALPRLRHPARLHCPRPRHSLLGHPRSRPRPPAQARVRVGSERVRQLPRSPPACGTGSHPRCCRFAETSPGDWMSGRGRPRAPAAGSVVVGVATASRAPRPTRAERPPRAPSRGAVRRPLRPPSPANLRSPHALSRLRQSSLANGPPGHRRRRPWRVRTGGGGAPRVRLGRAPHPPQPRVESPATASVETIRPSRNQPSERKRAPRLGAVGPRATRETGAQGAANAPHRE